MKRIYPNCSVSFNKWLSTNPKYSEFFNSLNIKTFDVTLRDGLQSIQKEEHYNYSTEVKLKIYNEINNKYKPNYLEIGSLVSKKILPIMADSLEIYEKTWKPNTNNFILLPSKSNLSTIINHNCNNISLITSVSESFQLANTKKTINETKSEILEIMYEIYSNPNISNPRVKLYLSCIDHCPITGKIPLDFIANEIKYYYEICKPDVICLSDTCGNLALDNFIELIEMVKNLGVSTSKLSLHLHIDKNNLNNSQEIFSNALDRNILEFDVSFLESGGCSVTMGSKTKPNLTYSLYYKFLCDYIVNKIDKK